MLNFGHVKFASGDRAMHAALFAPVSNDDDQTADRHEDRSCGNRRKTDCCQADQEPDPPFGQKMLANGPPRHIEGCSDQDDQGDGA